MAFTTACAHRGEPEMPDRQDALGAALVGQVLLPGGFARRGTELHATVVAPDGELINRWLFFDDQGRFSHILEGDLSSVTVTAGPGAEVFRLSGEQLPEVNQDSEVDVGVIDLRDRLRRHDLLVRAAKGAPAGEIRVAMWFGLPPVGPGGESVSLGSKQFPTGAIDQVQEWLVPLEGDSWYFLVERPAKPKQPGYWQSGYQKLFGPFTSSELPTELKLP